MGAHPNEYKRLAPPNSYIHIDGFKSPAELATYLKFLDTNDELYNSYFLWKGTGEFINTKFLCRLCAMVHIAPYFPMWYKNVRKWWLNDDICFHSGSPKWIWRRRNESLSYAREVAYDYIR